MASVQTPSLAITVQQIVGFQKHYDQVVEDVDDQRIQDDAKRQIQDVEKQYGINRRGTQNQDPQSQKPNSPDHPQSAKEQKQILYCRGKFTLKNILVSSIIAVLFLVFIIYLGIFLNNYFQQFKGYKSGQKTYTNQKLNYEIRSYYFKLTHFKPIGTYPNVTGHITTVGPIKNDNRLLITSTYTPTVPQVAIITFTDPLTNTFFRSYNPDNFQVYICPQTLMNYYSQNFLKKKKRFLAYLQLSERKLQTDEAQTTTTPATDIKPQQTLQDAYCQATGSLKQNTQVTEVLFNKGIQKDGVLDLQAKEPISSRLLQAIKKSTLSDAQKQKILTDAINQIVRPFFQQCVQKLELYSKQIEQQLGIVFSSDIDILLTKQKMEAYGSSENHFLITTVYTSLFANKPKNIKSTITVPQTIFDNVKNCYDNQKQKFCTLEEFQSNDSPYKISNPSGDKKIYKYWKISLKINQPNDAGQSDQKANPQKKNPIDSAPQKSDKATQPSTGDKNEISPTTNSQTEANSGAKSTKPQTSQNKQNQHIHTDSNSPPVSDQPIKVDSKTGQHTHTDSNSPPVTEEPIKFDSKSGQHTHNDINSPPVIDKPIKVDSKTGQHTHTDSNSPPVIDKPIKVDSKTGQHTHTDSNSPPVIDKPIKVDSKTGEHTHTPPTDSSSPSNAKLATSESKTGQHTHTPTDSSSSSNAKSATNQIKPVQHTHPSTTPSQTTKSSSTPNEHTHETVAPSSSDHSHSPTPTPKSTQPIPANLKQTKINAPVNSQQTKTDPSGSSSNNNSPKQQPQKPKPSKDAETTSNQPKVENNVQNKAPASPAAEKSITKQANSVVTTEQSNGSEDKSKSSNLSSAQSSSSPPTTNNKQTDQTSTSEIKKVEDAIKPST